MLGLITNQGKIYHKSERLNKVEKVVIIIFAVSV